MNLRTYQAYTMAEALAAVKQDLGASAVILNTRSFRRGGFLGLGRRTVIEVSATAAEQPAANLKSRSPKQTLARRAYARKPDPSVVNESIEATPHIEQPSETDRERTRRLAQEILDRQPMPPIDDRRAAPETGTVPIDPAMGSNGSAPAPLSGDESDSTLHGASRAVADASVDAQEGQSKPVAQRYLLQPTVAGLNEQPDSDAGGTTVAALAEPADPASAPGLPTTVAAPASLAVDDTHIMQDELSAIRQLVGQILQRQTSSTANATPSLPAKLFDCYLELVAQDLSSELADQVVSVVRRELTGTEEEDEEKVREAVLRHLIDYIPKCSQLASPMRTDGRPFTIVLVGPTGVGKTTTLAKLAASFKLRHDRRVGLITADTYRIAAVDQLRTYASIIGLPLQVVLTPAEMQQAVLALGDCDVVLIDTAGRSQHDESRLSELKEFVASAEPDEVHLVLSSTASERVLLAEAEAFSCIGVDKVVLTKLDEAVNFGVIVNVVRQVGKELSFFTTGQEVPDHIEPGRPERLADLLMGGRIDA